MALTTPFRPAIKYILIAKYIESLGLKLPKMPQLPNFEPPPMPDTQALVEELYKLKEQSGKFDGSSLYTDEYNDALKKYGELVTAAREKYEPQILDIKKKIADARFSKNEYGSGKEELSSLISDKNKLEDEYHDALKAAKTDSGIDDVKQKFKKIEKK